MRRELTTILNHLKLGFLDPLRYIVDMTPWCGIKIANQNIKIRDCHGFKLFLDGTSVLGKGSFSPGSRLRRSGGLDTDVSAGMTLSVRASPMALTGTRSMASGIAIPVRERGTCSAWEEHRFSALNRGASPLGSSALHRYFMSTDKGGTFKADDDLRKRYGRKAVKCDYKVGTVDGLTPIANMFISRPQP